MVTEKRFLRFKVSVIVKWQAVSASVNRTLKGMRQTTDMEGRETDRLNKQTEVRRKG